MELRVDDVRRGLSRPRRSRRVRDLLARGGPAALVARGRHRLREFCDVRRARLLVRELAAPVADVPPLVPLTLGAMTPAIVGRLREPGCDLPERRIDDFLRRLDAGHVGVVASTGDRIAAYGWLTTSDYFESWSGVAISLARGEGYVYNGYVFPAFRGRRLYPSVLAWRLRTLAALGCRTVYSIVAVTNAPALASHARLGFVGVRDFGYVKVAGLRWWLGMPIASSRDA